MNLQEMATLADLDLDVTVIIMNNQHLGFVRQHRSYSFTELYCLPLDSKLDFAAIGRQFGIRGITSRTPWIR
jgi:acetolactate synthase-1/2/3 large subunit